MSDEQLNINCTDSGDAIRGVRIRNVNENCLNTNMPDT
jgi:hypothetical protein